jgi:hypothetical protein
MRLFIKPLVVIVFMLLILNCNTHAQYATRKLSKKQQAYIDSLKQIEYNYVFPILGQQAYSRGFDIPYPAGAMGNFIWMRQGIVIENFQLGIKTDNVDIPMTPADFLGFGRNINTSYAGNIRPDLWIFPFLNVYGLFGYGASTTEVNLNEPIELKSIVNQGMSTAGFGLMGAFGLGPLFMSVDANWTWTKPELLEDPVKVRVLGLRLGKTFQFRSHPERNIGVWAGGMRARMGSSTVGQIRMGDAIPQETWDRVDEIVDNYNTWYESLDPIKKAIVDNSAFPDFIDALDNADGDAIVRYGMDKRPEQEWNVVIGGQFQLNKRWQFRTEGGIIGDRKSLLVSANYRFRI